MALSRGVAARRLCSECTSGGRGTRVSFSPSPALRPRQRRDGRPLHACRRQQPRPQRWRCGHHQPCRPRMDGILAEVEEFVSARVTGQPAGRPGGAGRRAARCALQARGLSAARRPWQAWCGGADHAGRQLHGGARGRSGRAGRGSAIPRPAAGPGLQGMGTFRRTGAAAGAERARRQGARRKHAHTDQLHAAGKKRDAMEQRVQELEERLAAVSLQPWCRAAAVPPPAAPSCSRHRGVGLFSSGCSEAVFSGGEHGGLRSSPGLRTRSGSGWRRSAERKSSHRRWPSRSISRTSRTR